MTFSPAQPLITMLDTGRCEPLKAGVHTAVMLLAGVCAVYNTAAWLKRRQRHLAVNAVVYVCTFWWERSHVIHHLAECAPRQTEASVPELPNAA